MCCKQGRIDHRDCVESCSLPGQCRKLSYRKINGPRKQPLPCIRAKTKHTQNTSINQHNCTKQGISQRAPRLCIQFAQHLLCQKKIQNISTRLVSAKTPEAQGCKRQPQSHPNTAPGCRMPHAHAPSKHSHRSCAQDAPSSLPAMTSKAVTSICCLNKRQKPWQLRSCFKNPLACSVGLTQKNLDIIRAVLHVDMTHVVAQPC